MIGLLRPLPNLRRPAAGSLRPDVSKSSRTRLVRQEELGIDDCCCGGRFSTCPITSTLKTCCHTAIRSAARDSRMELIARCTNRESECTGRLWEGECKLEDASFPR